MNINILELSRMFESVNFAQLPTLRFMIDLKKVLLEKGISDELCDKALARCRFVISPKTLDMPEYNEVVSNIAQYIVSCYNVCRISGFGEEVFLGGMSRFVIEEEV